MAKYLLIKKYKSEGTNLYYHVCPVAAKDFYINIDTKEKKIRFYQDITLSQSIGEMSLVSNEPFIHLPDIDYESLVLATVQAVKALQKNEFPEYISKQS